MNMKGVHCQMSVTMTAGIARPGVPSQILGSKPTKHQVVDEAKIGVEQVPPEESHHHGGDHDRHDEDRPEDGDAPGYPSRA